MHIRGLHRDSSMSQKSNMSLASAVDYRQRPRPDAFGDGVSPLRSSSNFMPESWSPALAGGHQSLRHLLSGNGSAQRRQHAFQQGPHMPGGAACQSGSARMVMVAQCHISDTLKAVCLLRRCSQRPSQLMKNCVPMARQVSHTPYIFAC